MHVLCTFCQKQSVADLPVLYQNNSQFQSVYSHAQKEGIAKVSGLVGSKHTFLVRSLFTQHPTTVVWILRDKEEAAYFLNDLEVFMEQRPLFLPVELSSAVQHRRNR